MLTVEVGRPPGEDAADSQKTREASVPRQAIYVWVGTLGRLFCSRRLKRTATKEEMGHHIEVAVISGNACGTF